MPIPSTAVLGWQIILRVVIWNLSLIYASLQSLVHPNASSISMMPPLLFRSRSDAWPCIFRQTMHWSLFLREQDHFPICRYQDPIEWCPGAMDQWLCVFVRWVVGGILFQYLAHPSGGDSDLRNWVSITKPLVYHSSHFYPPKEAPIPFENITIGFSSFPRF